MADERDDSLCESYQPEINKTYIPDRERPTLPDRNQGSYQPRPAEREQVTPPAGGSGVPVKK